ncbi:MAG TPA: glutamyl-tRNA reductase [Methylomirabilota bacterium]|nr:glutamyl-tRNA reductase [Methylomirabilota bacterium]
MEIVLVGLNHRTAPVAVRERVSFTVDQARRAAEELRTQGILEEALVLSTCNRSEVYGVPPESVREARAAVSAFLSGFHSVEADELHPSLYHHQDHAAVRHLFGVAAGLDSMLLGESEILGQVREAYRAAQQLGATGPVLNRLFQSALEVGKRVRAETELGSRPMSVASAGIKLAGRIFGKLHDRTALVLGAGAVSEQVAAQLRDRGIGRLLVMNRSRERAEAIAGRFDGTAVAWADWAAALRAPDIVVSSVSADDPVLQQAAVAEAMAARGNRALLLMDLGVPRNVDPAVADLYNVYLYNIDDLAEIVEQNRRARESEIPRAQDIVEEHVGKFLSWQASVELVGVLEALRARLEGERRAHLDACLGRVGHLSTSDKQRIEAFVDELLEKLLMQPAERLRGERDLRRKIQSLEALRDLFLPGPSER